MASSNSDRDALSKLLQMGTMAEYQSEFEILINRVMGISESLLKSFYISELKLDLQRELLRSRPTTLGEAFSLAQIAEARYEEERPTITIDKPNDLLTKVQVQDIEKTTQGRGDKPNRILLVTIHHIIYPITVEVLYQVFSPHGPRVLQLWEIIGIGDVYELMDNKGNHNFVHPNAGERMHLQAMVIGRPYQGVGGSPEEASWEWMSDSHTPWAAGIGRRKSLKCYVQGSRRRMKKKEVDHGSKRRDCPLFEASVFASLNPGLGSFAHRRIWDPRIKSAFQDITLRTRWFQRSRECYALSLGIV
ncbi:polypyrimidine tract-binding protein homolog 3 [Tanacetum coccineum]